MRPKLYKAFTKEEIFKIAEESNISTEQQFCKRIKYSNKKPHEDRTYYIYRILHPENLHSYIGQTDNLLIRWNSHLADAYGKKRENIFAIHKSIIKYGRDGLKWQIIDKVIGLSAANKSETFYIEKYNSTTPNGYNMNKGGDNQAWSEQRILDRKEALANGTVVYPKGKDHWNFGKNTQTKEYKSWRSKYCAGENSSRAKLNAKEVVEIYTKYMNGATSKELTLLYNIGDVNLSSILHKETWKDTTKDLPDIENRAERRALDLAGLTKASLLEIREEYKKLLELNNTFRVKTKEVFYKEMCNKYYISRNTVRNIIYNIAFTEIK